MSASLPSARPHSAADPAQGRASSLVAGQNMKSLRPAPTQLEGSAYTPPAIKPIELRRLPSADRAAA